MGGKKKLEVIPGIDKVFLLRFLKQTFACFDVGVIDVDHCAFIGNTGEESSSR
ncbi:TPA: hypothetical protein SL686_005879 [Pseudomonas aeruginosa]|uniref:hypothetical protein n=1 Tax=Pseudomonas TaxID=286 RepID=UPI000AA1EC71|nr:MULTISPECIES: hypothetical protein [Pseudomonas]EKX3871437.1 hypothetical protein [Pseudomonas aeruginosa]MBG5155456.1 hypothetical protein [Pseudomonas aeruginosa]MCS7890636.1 hypothetical protein [Pseudomonas aeruginosa]QKZ54354.1 hypothetical protein HWN50_05380 [Pseudomonas aeruginosa]UKW03354.1 hypothetical protein MCN99_06225 [Pseudomonas aeruginosa]